MAGKVFADEASSEPSRTEDENICFGRIWHGGRWRRSMELLLGEDVTWRWWHVVSTGKSLPEGGNHETSRNRCGCECPQWWSRFSSPLISPSESHPSTKNLAAVDKEPQRLSLAIWTWVVLVLSQVFLVLVSVIYSDASVWAPEARNASLTKIRPQWSFLEVTKTHSLAECAWVARFDSLCHQRCVWYFVFAISPRHEISCPSKIPAFVLHKSPIAVGNSAFRRSFDIILYYRTSWSKKHYMGRLWLWVFLLAFCQRKWIGETNCSNIPSF